MLDLGAVVSVALAQGGELGTELGGAREAVYRISKGVDQLLLLRRKIGRKHRAQVRRELEQALVEQFGGRRRNGCDVGEARLHECNLLRGHGRGVTPARYPRISPQARMVACVAPVTLRLRRARSGSSRRCRRDRNSRSGSWRDTAGGSPRRSRTAARRGSPW